MNFSPFSCLLLTLCIGFVACEKFEDKNASKPPGNDVLNILKKNVENDSIFDANEIAWNKLASYSMQQGAYFISVPVVSEKGIAKGKLMFEITESSISKKYLSYSLSSATIDGMGKGQDFTTHDVLNFLEKANHSVNTKSSYPSHCMICHRGISAPGGNLLDEITVTPEPEPEPDPWIPWDIGDPWDDEFDLLYGGGGYSLYDVRLQTEFCNAFHGIIDLSNIKNNLNILTLAEEQFIISLANLAAFSELGLLTESLKTDLVNFPQSSSLYSKLNRLNNHEEYTKGWKKVSNSSAGSNYALQSAKVGNTSFCLKYYPEKNGEYNALGLVKSGIIPHHIEGAIELIESLIVNNSNFGDDFLYDMHLYNAVNFMEDYCDE